jgi:hypothetical protein
MALYHWLAPTELMFLTCRTAGKFRSPAAQPQLGSTPRLNITDRSITHNAPYEMLDFQVTLTVFFGQAPIRAEFHCQPSGFTL